MFLTLIKGNNLIRKKSTIAVKQLTGACQKNNKWTKKTWLRYENLKKKNRLCNLWMALLMPSALELQKHNGLISDRKRSYKH